MPKAERIRSHKLVLRYYPEDVIQFKEEAERMGFATMSGYLKRIIDHRANFFKIKKPKKNAS